MGTRKKKKKRGLRRKRKILEEKEDGGPGRGRDGLQLKPAIFMFAVTWEKGKSRKAKLVNRKPGTPREYLLRIPKGGRKRAVLVDNFTSDI